MPIAFVYLLIAGIVAANAWLIYEFATRSTGGALVLALRASLGALFLAAAAIVIVGWNRYPFPHGPLLIVVALKVLGASLLLARCRACAPALLATITLESSLSVLLLTSLEGYYGG